jgi:hypothetical protein
MCSIEKDILDTNDLESILEDFASRNAQRCFLKKECTLFEVTIIVILPFLSSLVYCYFSKKN